MTQYSNDLEILINKRFHNSSETIFKNVIIQQTISGKTQL